MILATLTVCHQVGPTRDQVTELLPLFCHGATNLYINWDERIDTVFFRALTSTGPFQHLRKLMTFPRSLEQAPMFESLHGLCPALEELVVL